MAPCLPLLRCRGVGSHESPVKPPRPPQYQISRQRSLSSIKTASSGTIVRSSHSSNKRHSVAVASPPLGGNFRQDCIAIGRDISTQSLTSLIRRANNFLSRSTTLASLPTICSSSPEATAKPRLQSHLPNPKAAIGQATARAPATGERLCPIRPTSSLCHKRHYSDLRAQFRRMATPVTDCGKRMSRVVSEDGESCWITDDEIGDGDDDDGGFWMK